MDQPRVVKEGSFMASLGMHKCYYQLKVHSFNKCFRGWRLANDVLKKAGFVGNQAKASPHPPPN